MGSKEKCRISAGRKSQLVRKSVNGRAKDVPQGAEDNSSYTMNLQQDTLSKVEDEGEDWAKVQADMEHAGDRPIQEQEQVLTKALKKIYPTITP
jgi:hypothetical protein